MANRQQRETDQHQHRRDFIRNTASITAAAAAAGFYSSLPAAAASKSANDQVTVGVMGLNNRGSKLAKLFLGQPNVAVGGICDVDSRVIEKGLAIVGEHQKNKPETCDDMRRLLDDKSIDVLVCAAPNHWHAPAAILGCAAGKHVYVEKPASHTPWEGEMAVKAARKHDRVVQLGTQRRSSPLHVEAIGKVHEGAIGNVMFARAWYKSRRPSIGDGKATAVPDWLNYELWQGPTTEVPYKDNVVHYNWHWHWHWGNGELGNNGIHVLDVARWGTQVDYPTRVTSAGGRYRWKDDQETADTHVVNFEFDNKLVSWEGISWSPYDSSGGQFGITFHGDNGTLRLLDSGWQIFDMKNKLTEENAGKLSQTEHVANFLACIREEGRPNADIEEGHKSTLLCHLGNIALRTGRTINTDPSNGHIKNDDEAASLWTKEYRNSWTPEV